MHWNHRVVKHVSKYVHEEEEIVEDTYQICEVYYNGKDIPTGYCEASVVSETIEGLQEEVERFKRAIAQPILNADTDFTGDYNDDEEEEDETTE